MWCVSGSHTYTHTCVWTSLHYTQECNYKMLFAVDVFLKIKIASILTTINVHRRGTRKPLELFFLLECVFMNQLVAL